MTEGWWRVDDVVVAAQRGRTNKLPARRGNVPATYNRLTDAIGAELLDQR